MYQELQDSPKKYNVVALSKMNKVRGTTVNDYKEKIP